MQEDAVAVQVALCCSVPAHWLLLKSRLEKICPRSQGAQALWRWNSRGQEPLQLPFLLQVTSYNREGVLHGENVFAPHDAYLHLYNGVPTLHEGVPCCGCVHHLSSFVLKKPVSVIVLCQALTRL